jgi:5,10-methylenetetrahydromethanopterin reductase
MKFGTVSLWRDSTAAFVDEVRTAESWGFDLVGVGDTPGGYRELYVSLSVAALNTSRVAVGPMVTNPVTRHPAVTASALGTIDRLSGGRVVLGIGTGGSAVWSLSRPPAKIDELRAYIETVRALMTRGEATEDGRHVVVSGIDRAFPVFVSAEGPRALRLAGALADGVILHAGTSVEAINWCLAAVADGAAQAGRDPGQIEVWMMLKASIADSREEALQEVKVGLAGSAQHALRTGAAAKGVPLHLLEPVRELVERYDVHQHAVALSSNGDLVDELGLASFLADHFGLVGTPQDCVERLRTLEARGVHGVLIPAAGRDPLGLITRLGREVLPHLKSQDA